VNLGVTPGNTIIVQSKTMRTFNVAAQGQWVWAKLGDPTAAILHATKCENQYVPRLLGWNVAALLNRGSRDVFAGPILRQHRGAREYQFSYRGIDHLTRSDCYAINFTRLRSKKSTSHQPVLLRTKKSSTAHSPPPGIARRAALQYAVDMKPSISLAALAVAAACGGPEAAPPAIAPAAPAADRAASDTISPARPAPAREVSSAPTERSAADRQRDAAREPLATAVVDAYSNWNGLFSSLVATWSPDGKRFVFGSLRDGLPEIYEADPARPSADARAVTTGPERAIWAGYTRDGKSLLFLRDQKGDENHAIWRVPIGGGEPVNLTAGEVMHRDEPLLPRRQPGSILYSAARSREPSSHLYRLTLGSGEPRLIYSQAQPGGAIDVTGDGKRVLFTEFRSDADIVVREVDVATGKARRIYPTEGRTGSLYSAAYTGDGSRVLVSTDDGDHVALLALDAATGKEVARYVDRIRTAALSFAVSPAGDRVALRVDAGNHGELRILDARTLAVRRAVAVPLGDVKLGAWRPDGRAFSALISLPDAPADVFAVDATTGQVAPLRKDARPGLPSLPPVTVSIEHARAFDGLDIPINVYLPRAEPGEKLPTLVVFHGGPTFSAAVRWNPYIRFYTALGYAVLEPNVRGSSGFGIAYANADNREKRADWLRDVATTNAWARAQPWCDPERVVVYGGSYGGYTTLMAMTRQPALWRAGVDLFGMADLRTFLKSAVGARWHAALVAEYGDIAKDAQLIAEFSPMRDVDKIVRPLFVYHGANDPRVPRSESDTIVKTLRSRGIPVEYMVAANEGHSVDHRENKIELLTRTARFLEDALR
jgi:dipeptidyl aminopeptidase/acylaminoacyl peptidase